LSYICLHYGFQKLNPYHDQHKQPKYIKQLINIEKKVRWMYEIFDYKPTKVKGSKSQYDCHHHHKCLDHKL